MGLFPTVLGLQLWLQSEHNHTPMSPWDKPDPAQSRGSPQCLRALDKVSAPSSAKDTQGSLGKPNSISLAVASLHFPVAHSGNSRKLWHRFAARRAAQSLEGHSKEIPGCAHDGSSGRGLSSFLFPMDCFAHSPTGHREAWTPHSHGHSCLAGMPRAVPGSAAASARASLRAPDDSDNIRGGQNQEEMLWGCAWEGRAESARHSGQCSRTQLCTAPPTHPQSPPAPALLCSAPSPSLSISLGLDISLLRGALSLPVLTEPIPPSVPSGRPYRNLPVCRALPGAGSVCRWARAAQESPSGPCKGDAAADQG